MYYCCCLINAVRKLITLNNAYIEAHSSIKKRQVSDIKFTACVKLGVELGRLGNLGHL